MFVVPQEADQAVLVVCVHMVDYAGLGSGIFCNLGVRHGGEGLDREGLWRYRKMRWTLAVVALSI